MIRAVQHFLWYLEYHSNGGRKARSSTRSARLYSSGRPDLPRVWESTGRTSRRSAGQSGPTSAKSGPTPPQG